MQGVEEMAGCGERLAQALTQRLLGTGQECGIYSKLIGGHWRALHTSDTIYCCLEKMSLTCVTE